MDEDSCGAVAERSGVWILGNLEVWLSLTK